MIAAPALDVGTDFAEKAFGVAAIEGGAHSNLGTCNVLFGCGSDFYLEVLAADQSSDAQSPFRAAIAALPKPEIYTYIVRTDDLDAVIDRARKAGVRTVGPQSLERQTPESEVLSWRLLFFADHGHGGLLPIFIDWGNTPNPAENLPADLELVDFSVASPDATDLSRLYEALSIPVQVSEGPTAEARMTVKSSAGETTIRSPASAGFILG